MSGRLVLLWVVLVASFFLFRVRPKEIESWIAPPPRPITGGKAGGLDQAELERVIREQYGDDPYYGVPVKEVLWFAGAAVVVGATWKGLGTKNTRKE